MNIDGIFPHIQKNQLEAIPIPHVTGEERLRLEQCADAIIASKQANLDADTSEWTNIIDELIFAHYDVTDKERELINRFFNKNQREGDEIQSV